MLASSWPVEAGRFQRYTVAVLAAILAVLVHALLDPLLAGNSTFVISLTAVVFAAWYAGFGPALLTLLLSTVTIVFLFVEPRYTFALGALDDQVLLGLFMVAGIACALLGGAHRRAEDQMRAANEKLERRVEERTADLHREREFLRAVLEHVADGIVACDAEGTLTLFNRATTELHGLPAEPLPPERWAEHYCLYHGDGTTPMRIAEVPLMRALAGERVRDAEMVVAPTGRPAHVLLASGQALFDAAGRKLGAVVSMHDVTDRRRAQEARDQLLREQVARAELHKNEERFRVMAETVPGILFITGPDGGWDYLNQRWAEFTGLSAAASRGAGWLQAVHPDDRAQVSANWSAAVRGRKRWMSRHRFRAFDGSHRWFLARANPVLDAGGQVVQWIGVIADIEESVRAETALRERARLAALRADVLSALGSDADARTVLQRCSEALVGHLDAAFARVWTLDEAVQVLELQASAGMYTHTDGPHARVPVGAFKIGRIAQTRRPHLTNNVPNDPQVSDREWARREGMVAFAGYPLLVEGRVLGVVAMFARQPLSPATLAELAPLAESIAQYLERKRAEAAARAGEERYRFLAETLPALVWSSRADGTPDYHNSRWYEYTGFAADEGQDPAAEVVHPDDRPRTLDRWQRALETGTKYQHEFRLRRADGAYHWFLAQALPMRGPDGDVARWFGTAVDIDDQKRQAELLEQRVAERTAELLQEVEERRKAEEQVRSTAVELARSNEELEKFAYVASHDLQEPLRKIQAFGDRLRARYRGGLGDEGLDYLERILKSAGRMRRLIEDLLDLSRVTTQGQPFTPVDLGAVAEGVLSDLEERIEETGGAVEVGPLPIITADATQMRQLLQNLIGNALRFRRPEVPPAVAVRSEVIPAIDGTEDPPVCRITVTDNGIGFDEKYLDRIFQVFQRLHGRGEYEGNGVGLAICRKIVERHGGAITARSTPGEGATFVVTLPTRHPDGQ